MIYVSSCCSKRRKIGAAILELAEHGFQNIELSGGTRYYDKYELDLFELKDKYDLNLLLHNYFPPPKENFALNLASLNDEVYQKTLEHLKKGIDLSKKLGAPKFGFHAGLFIDINYWEFGNRIHKRELYAKDKATMRFCEGYSHLIRYAGDIEVCIENHVVSHTNANTYRDENPFMLTDYKAYLELRNLMEFKLLLDIGHLKVTSYSLGLSFDEELDKMMPVSDYIHLSDNDGFHDQNEGFCFKSKLLDEVSIRKDCLVDKTITLEVYTGIDDLKESFKLITEIINE